MHRIRKKMAALIALLCLTSCAGAGSGAGTTKKDGTLQSRQTTDNNDPFTPEETVPDDTTPDEEFSSERIYTYRTYENGAVKGKSLDEIEKEYYLQVRSTPFDRPSEIVKTQNGAYGSDGKAISSSVCLDGGWQLLATKGSESYYYTEEMLPSDLYSKMNIVGLPVEASSQYTALGEDKFMPSGINDGAFMYDGADDWVSAGPATDREPWFIIDLTETRSINGFILYSFGALGVFDGSDRPENTRSFTVSVSIDKKKWTEIYDTSSNTASIADVRLDKYYDARYLMVDLNQTEQTAKGYARIIEFELYGKEKVFSPSQLDWKNAYNVTVPGSVPGELHEAGVIDNPYFDHNDGPAREAVGKTWWLKRDFDFKPSGGKTILSFDGICDRADVWINNVYLGFHQGMYGGPEFDVTDYIADGGNTVVVRLYPVVGDWTQTVAFNISYGWTQVNIPPLGIWQSVHINSLARIEIIDPFIATADTSGNMDFCCDLQNTRGGAISGTLIAEIIPKNFRGETCFWTYRVDADKRKTSVNLSFDISEPKLWWPNGVGEQNLYLLKLRFVDNNGAVQSEKAVQFGIRTIEMRPLADIGAYSDVYNWTFVINGREMFLHGCNWYPIDALLNFTEEHYGRNIALARNQGVQLFRAWGNGTVETEKFYDLCDENGIFVYQEWPISWDSYKTQPEQVLYKTVKRNTIRLRNRASLLMWGGGNEGVAFLTENILNEIGRITVENDGTRPWHRTDPYGDASHLYDTYMGGMPLEENFTYESPFIGEFGIPSLPMRETIEKYAPKDDINEWPIFEDSAISYHSVAFGGFESILAKGDIENIRFYAEEFLEIKSLDDLILGSQLAQSVGLLHTLQRARANFPSSTGICYYKFDDIAPCTTWAPIDYYGTPKMTYYLLQDVYQPLAAVAIFDKASYYGENTSIPVYLLDDSGFLEGEKWTVNARVYNASLGKVWEKSFEGYGSAISKYLFDITLTSEHTASAPLFFVTEVAKDGEIRARNYYFLNYNERQGCLFDLPVTTVKLEKEGNLFRLTNTGSVPAVAVSFDCAEVSTTFLPTDNYIWLEPGETQVISVNSTDGISGVSFWNKAVDISGESPGTPQNLVADDISCDSVKLKWNTAKNSRGYYIYRDGKIIAATSDTEYTALGLCENGTYNFEVSAYFDNGEESVHTQNLTVKCSDDLTAPAVLEWRMISPEIAQLVFSKDMDKNSAEKTANYSVSGGVKVKNVNYNEKTKTAELALSGASGSKEYMISVSGIRDASKAGNTVSQTGTVACGLKLYWNFDAGKGCILYDVTGNAGLGTLLTDGVTFEDNSGIGLGRCVKFDGTKSAISVRKTTLSLKNGFTISAYIKTDVISDAPMTVIARNIYPISGYMSLVIYNGKPMFYSGDVTPRLNFVGEKNVSDGKWHQIGVTYDGKEIKMFVDGENVGTFTGISGEIRRDDCEWSIGRLVRNVNRFSGSIDEVRIYDCAITPVEMKALAK